jgi:hypothetical protein
MYAKSKESSLMRRLSTQLENQAKNKGKRMSAKVSPTNTMIENLQELKMLSEEKERDLQLSEMMIKFARVEAAVGVDIREKEIADYFKKQLLKTYFKAIRKNNVELALNYLIRFGINIETKDELGNTALNLSAQSGFSQMITELLDHGADEYSMNMEGKSADDYAHPFI